jgi:hypothetical protein
MSTSTHPRDKGLFVLSLVTLVSTASMVSKPARGQKEPIRLAYSAPPVCPSSDPFTAEIRARTALADFTEAGVARVFRVSIHEMPSGYEGVLTVTSGDVEGEPRRIRDKNCGEVASALALMIAVAVDPQASTASLSELESEPPVSGPAPSPWLLARIAPAKEPARTAPRAALPPPEPRGSWAMGLDAVAIGGMAPNVAVGAMVFAETSHPTPGASAYRLSLGHVDSSPLAGTSPNATVRWIGARLDACPVGARLHATIRLLPCSAFTLGELQARGEGAPHPRMATRWASSLDVGGRLQWRPAGAVLLEAGGGASIPLLQRTFVFEQPRQVIYEMPWMGWSVAIGAGVAFL